MRQSLASIQRHSDRHAALSPAFTGLSSPILRVLPRRRQSRDKFGNRNATLAESSLANRQSSPNLRESHSYDSVYKQLIPSYFTTRTAKNLAIFDGYARENAVCQHHNHMKKSSSSYRLLRIRGLRTNTMLNSARKTKPQLIRISAFSGRSLRGWPSFQEVREPFIQSF